MQYETEPTILSKYYSQAEYFVSIDFKQALQN